ncbi:DUF4129 domain-containing protein [Paucisalibacillus sp. EB02]|uniref:DUF4129 domain-containing protein n=1 Tax=Paucisalibacillus sp. EB02 TaxID=1347087 RepID=UPI0004AC7593|nr:DUF4129 domain-containing protein [Paucisalibacillus sp. EB02]
MIELNQARDTMEDILNTREYRIYYEDNRNFLEEWWDSVVEWFQELLASIFTSLEPSNGFATGLVIILSLVALILVITAIFFSVRYYNRKKIFKEQSPLYHKSERDWTYQDHIVQSKEQEKKGNLQASTRHLFLALLLYFHEKGYVEARIWKTNWEYFEELKRSDNKRAESFYQLARDFDDVVYGERTVEAESYEGYKEMVLHWIQEPPESGMVKG